MIISVIGFGRFGALATKYLVKDFAVIVFNPSDKSPQIEALGAKPVTFAEACMGDIIIVAVPISQFSETMDYIAPFVKPNTLVIDVCSVKEYPVHEMQKKLPKHVSILATHPMFGPDSATDTLQGAKIVLCPERIDDERYACVKDYLMQLGLIIIETTAQKHDRQMATSLALTHFIGRGLAAYGAKPLEIDTEGYKRLLHILDVVTHDTWQLFMDMQHYNNYTQEARQKFMQALQQIEDKINDTAN